jgi:biopolymer transport protein ExbD
MAQTMRRRVQLGRRRPIEEPEIIVIPMIDVMMFLLFFFMVASLAMVVQNAIPVQLPKAATGEDRHVEPLTITLRPDGAVYLGTKPVTIDTLATELEAVNKGQNTTVTLNVDQRVPYGSVVAAMDESRKAGVTGFAFSDVKR